MILEFQTQDDGEGCGKTHEHLQGHCQTICHWHEEFWEWGQYGGTYAFSGEITFLCVFLVAFCFLAFHDVCTKIGSHKNFRLGLVHVWVADVDVLELPLRISCYKGMCNLIPGHCQVSTAQDSLGYCWSLT